MVFDDSNASDIQYKSFRLKCSSIFSIKLESHLKYTIQKKKYFEYPLSCGKKLDSIKRMAFLQSAFKYLIFA